MPPPNLFIGVVTYPGTRFPDSSGASGLAQQLAQRLPSTVVEVNSVDLWEPDEAPTSRDARLSRLRELKAEWRWARFLGYSKDPGFLVRIGARWAKYASLTGRSLDPRSVVRLMNIELSHLHLWRTAIASGAGLILILEDDAGSDHVDDLAQGVQAWIDEGFQPAFVNLSTSFALKDLEASRHLHSVGDPRWSGTQIRALMLADRPITNTVCAILYGRDFLTRFVRAWESASIAPVLPIDWKMNMVAMDMFDAGAFEQSSVWWLEPAPIQQRSML